MGRGLSRCEETLYLNKGDLEAIVLVPVLLGESWTLGEASAACGPRKTLGSRVAAAGGSL